MVRTAMEVRLLALSATFTRDRGQASSAFVSSPYASKSFPG